jgi:hypothetical protein
VETGDNLSTRPQDEGTNGTDGAEEGTDELPTDSLDDDLNETPSENLPTHVLNMEKKPDALGMFNDGLFYQFHTDPDHQFKIKHLQATVQATSDDNI